MKISVFPHITHHLNSQPKGGAADSDDDDSDDDDNAVAFAAATKLKQTMDRVKILESRIKNIGTYVTTSKRQPELQQKVKDMKASVDDLEQKHKDIRNRVKDEIRAFNQRKEERILKEATKKPPRK